MSDQLIQCLRKRTDIQVISLVGIAKNVGKTTVLNALICQSDQHPFGLCSVGVDGEKKDVWSGRWKPSIWIPEGTIVATAHSCYQGSPSSWKILESTSIESLAGKVYLAEAKRDTEIKLVGVSTRAQAFEISKRMKDLGCKKVFIDGAYDRKSVASPRYSDGLILVVGASFSHSLRKLEMELKEWLYKLSLPSLHSLEIHQVCKQQEESKKSILFFNSSWEYRDSQLLTLDYTKQLSQATDLYLPGAVTERLIQSLIANGFQGRLILDDWTHLFCKQESMKRFEKQGIHCEVINGAELLGIAVNTVSPEGMQLPPDLFYDQVMRLVKDIPVFDVIRGMWGGGE